MTNTNIAIQWSGQKIRTARLARLWSQQELADKLGCRMQTVCEWEKGHYVPQNAYQKLLNSVFRKI